MANLTTDLPTRIQMARHFRQQADLMEDWDTMLRAEPLAPEDILAPEQVAAAYRLIADTFDPPISGGTHDANEKTANDGVSTATHERRYSPVFFRDRLMARRGEAVDAEGAQGAAASLPPRSRPRKPRAGR